MKQDIHEALVVLSKCPSNHKLYGVRAEKVSSDNWLLTWAFPMKESSAVHEGYDKTNIKGSIEFSAEYPGCPFCDCKGFVLCHCGHLTCDSQIENGVSTCAWCGSQGRVTSYDGERISAGLDA